MRFFSSQIFIVIFVLALCGALQAHPGHEHPAWEVDEFEDEASMSAETHPLAGIDHLLAMLALGALFASVLRIYPGMAVRLAGASVAATGPPPGSGRHFPG